MKVDCNPSEYTEHIQGINDSALLDILRHISKASVPDRYEAVVQECKRRGLIVEDGDRILRIRERRHDRLARKMGAHGISKRSIVPVVLICAISAIPFGIGIWHGLKHGLLVGVVCFLICGGIEWLWAAARWFEEDRPQKNSRKTA